MTERSRRGRSAPPWLMVIALAASVVFAVAFWLNWAGREAGSRAAGGV